MGAVRWGYFRGGGTDPGDSRGYRQNWLALGEGAEGSPPNSLQPAERPFTKLPASRRAIPYCGAEPLLSERGRAFGHQTLASRSVTMTIREMIAPPSYTLPKDFVPLTAMSNLFEGEKAKLSGPDIHPDWLNLRHQSQNPLREAWHAYMHQNNAKESTPKPGDRCSSRSCSHPRPRRLLRYVVLRNFRPLPSKNPVYKFR